MGNCLHAIVSAFISLKQNHDTAEIPQPSLQAIGQSQGFRQSSAGFDKRIKRIIGRPFPGGLIGIPLYLKPAVHTFKKQFPGSRRLVPAAGFKYLIKQRHITIPMPVYSHLFHSHRQGRKIDAKHGIHFFPVIPPGRHPGQGRRIIKSHKIRPCPRFQTPCSRPSKNRKFSLYRSDTFLYPETTDAAQ